MSIGRKKQHKILKALKSGTALLDQSMILINELRAENEKLRQELRRIRIRAGHQRRLEKKKTR